MTGVEPVSKNLSVAFLHVYPDRLCIPRFAIGLLSWSVPVRCIRYSLLKDDGCLLYLSSVFVPMQIQKNYCIRLIPESGVRCD